MARSLGKQIFSGGIAHIIVGSEETPFDVHLELLCDCSPYFDAIYKGQTLFAIEEDLHCLPDKDPDVFAEIIHWMYVGELSPDLSSHDQTLFLFKLWVLAREFEMPELQNAAISHCQRRFNKHPHLVPRCEAINFAYARTPRESPLRRLLVDMWVQRAPLEGYSADRIKLPRAFLEDLCGRLIEINAQTEATVEHAYPEERYHVPSPTRKRSERGPTVILAQDLLETPQSATPEQMQNRKVKTPIAPQVRAPSPSSISTLRSDGQKKPKQGGSV